MPSSAAAAALSAGSSHTAPLSSLKHPNSKMKKSLILLTAALIVAACGNNGASAKKTVESSEPEAVITKGEVGDVFIDFSVQQDPANPASVVRFSDYVGKGKFILVDFWASWCGPCRREMPNLRAVYDEFHGDKFDMLSVAVWDKPEDTAKAAEEENITWNQIVNAQQIPTDIYGIEGIPHIILFGPDGTILKRGLRGNDIREAVKEALDR